MGAAWIGQATRRATRQRWLYLNAASVRAHLRWFCIRVLPFFAFSDTKVGQPPGCLLGVRKLYRQLS